MIRDFEITDMNSLVKLMEQHATEAGEGVGTFEETNLQQEKMLASGHTGNIGNIGTGNNFACENCNKTYKNNHILLYPLK